MQSSAFNKFRPFPLAQSTRFDVVDDCSLGKSVTVPFEAYLETRNGAMFSCKPKLIIFEYINSIGNIDILRCY